MWFCIVRYFTSKPLSVILWNVWVELSEYFVNHRWWPQKKIGCYTWLHLVIIICNMCIHADNVQLLLIFFSSMLYLKFVMLWASVVMADYMLEFRFEFLWPFWMMLRSVYDSFKYQGLVSSLICIYLYVY